MHTKKLKMANEKTPIMHHVNWFVFTDLNAEQVDATSKFHRSRGTITMSFID